MPLNLILRPPHQSQFCGPVSETAKHNAPGSSTIFYANFVPEILYTDLICYKKNGSS